MLAPFIPRVPGDAFGREPHGYDDLRRLAARYARDALAGRTLANHATQLAITLTPEALAAATRPGAPAALLWAISELPLLLAHALYVRTVADRQRRPEVRRLQLLGATAEVAGRPVELLFVVRENFNGQCFLERVIERGASTRRRQDGGIAPDGSSGEAPDDADGAMPDVAGTSVMAQAGGTGSAAPPPASSSPLANTASPASKLLDQNIDYPKFFDEQFEPVAEIAAKLGVDPTLLLGLSAYESGWGTSRMYSDQFNPFGATPRGDKTSGLTYPSYRDAWQAWAKTFGPRVAGVGSDAAAFLRNLASDNRTVYGPTIGGNYLGAYSEDKKWNDRVQGAIEGVRKRLPLWQGNLNSLP